MRMIKIGAILALGQIERDTLLTRDKVFVTALCLDIVAEHLTKIGTRLSLVRTGRPSDKRPVCYTCTSLDTVEYINHIN